MLAPSTLPPVLERYELKYMIPMAYVEPMTHFLSLYCSLDYYSEKAHADNYFYEVNSLYFDSPQCEFLKQRIAGQAHRINMRARTYGDGSKPPYFLEIKQRMGIPGVVKKYRATVGDDEWPNLLTDPGFRVSETESEAKRVNKELFLRLAISYAIEPKILTKYLRRAFFSTVDDYVRVTMDTNMQYRKQHDYDLLSTHDMVNYDNETIYGIDTASDANVVLEIKCRVGEVPQWVLSLVNIFELKQQAFSKYANSFMVSHFDNGDWFMPKDRCLVNAIH